MLTVNLVLKPDAIKLPIKKYIIITSADWAEKAMAPHSNVLAWRIPGTGEPGGLPSMGSQSWTRLK